MGNNLSIDGNVSISGSGKIVLTHANNARVVIKEGFTAAQFVEINTTISGSGLLKNVRIDVTHAPGEGTAIVPLEGAYTINAFAKLDIEIAGTTPGTGYDQLKSVDPADAGLREPRL